MRKDKYQKWIDDNCSSLSDKTIVVLGATGSIGKEIVDIISSLSANVIIAVRSASKGEALILEMQEKYPKINYKLLLVDMSNRDSIDDFVKELHDMFDESYGVMDYQLFMFEDEFELIQACIETIRQVSPDYWFVWNLPYDEESIIKRIEYHGKNPAEVFSDPDMIGGPREFYFKGDNNPKPQKRRHISNIFTRSIPVDQLPLYSGIRVSRGSLQSMKLNQIAKTVLKDSKLDYSEYGDFKYFCYQNFWKFLIYNIKD